MDFKYFVITSGVFLSLFCLSGCGNMQDILKEYNNHFTPVESKTYTDISPDDASFVEETMLWERQYLVEDDGSITLTAPSRCSTYSWKIKLNQTDVALPDTIPVTQQTLSMYIPLSGLKIGNTYVVYLTVTNSQGISFTDKCDLIIYRKVSDY